MQTIEYDLPIFEDTDVADLNEYSTQMAKALKGQLDKFGNPLVFKGVVNSIEELPTTAESGEIYNVIDVNKNYIWNGAEWVIYSDNSQVPAVIDNLESTSTTDALSANQGKELKTAIEDSKKTIIVTEAGTDLNNYTEDGVYYFDSAYVPTNIPTGVNGWLQVMNGTKGTKQIWYRLGTTNSNDFETYVRTYASGTWSDWQQYLTKKSLENIGYFNGSTTSINSLNVSGTWRGHIQTASEDATYLGFTGGVIVETFVQSNNNPCIQRITQMGTGTAVIRYCSNNAFSYSDALHCVAVPKNKSYTITSDYFEFKKTSKRSSYIVEGSKVTLFMCLNTKQALTAKTQYSITGTHPTPVDYMATTGIFHTPTCAAEVFVCPDGTIKVAPCEDIASGKEFNVQITYFIY